MMVVRERTMATAIVHDMMVVRRMWMDGDGKGMMVTRWQWWW